jgi:hypothetical protein
METHFIMPPESHDFIGHKSAVGCGSKLDVLPGLPRPACTVLHDLFDKIKPQKRFSAHEMDRQVMSVPACCQQPIDGVLAGSNIHVDRSFLPLHETIAARQIAGLCRIEVKAGNGPFRRQAALNATPSPFGGSRAGIGRRRHLTGVRGLV